MDTKSLFVYYRNRLKLSPNKETSRDILRDLILVTKNRYRGLRVYVDEGNKDIEERLSFLLTHAKGSILDVGTYDGYFAHELDKRYPGVIGVDMMEESKTFFEKERKETKEKERERETVCVLCLRVYVRV